MAVIEGGNVITGGVTIEGSRPAYFSGSGAPTGGTTYDGQIAAGDLYIDADNGNVYEFTDVDTFTRIDTV